MTTRMMRTTTGAEVPFWAQPIDPRFTLAFSVRIDGEPHGKGSVRVIQTEDGPRGRQSPKSRAYEGLLATLTRYQRPRNGFSLPLSGPLVLRILAVKSRPKKLRRADQVPYLEDFGAPLPRTFDALRLYCPKTPDWDNVGKSAGDGLKKGGAVEDDARVVDGRAVTLWGRVGEAPFVECYVFAHRG